MNPSNQLTAVELIDGYAQGSRDPVAVLSETLDGLEATGRDRGIVLAVADRATVLAQAEIAAARWHAGTARPLEGVPFGAKDIISTADLPTTGGGSILGDSVPPVDATCIARLRDAGAILTAKLATSEFAAGQASNATFGPVGNPWDLDRWTGGSSTGSGAALGARLLPLTIGTDTGGSVRIPSAWCGTTGLKATYGRVPRTGVLPLSWSLDHVGPMARSARDCGLMLSVMAGQDDFDPNSAGPPVDPALSTGPWRDQAAAADIEGKRIGAVRGWFTDVCDRDVLTAWEDALAVLESAGAVIVPVELGLASAAFTAGWELLYAEAASLHEVHMDRLEQLDPGFVIRMLQGRDLSAVDYLRAMRLRTVVLDEALAALDSLDALCTIGVAGTAPRLDELLMNINDDVQPMLSTHSRATMFANVTGLPALMMPSGLDRASLPTAIQLIGRPFDEAGVIEIATALQERTSYHRSLPPTVSEDSFRQPIPNESASVTS